MISDAFLICLLSIGCTAIGAALGIGYKNALDMAALKAWKHEHEKLHKILGAKHDTT